MLSQQTQTLGQMKIFSFKLASFRQFDLKLGFYEILLYKSGEGIQCVGGAIF